MVTPKVGKRLFLKEHRKAKGLSDVEMAEKLGIERESVQRIEREYWRANPRKQADWAKILGIKPEELWDPPGKPKKVSLDAMIAGQSPEVQSLAEDIVRRLIDGKQ